MIRPRQLRFFAGVGVGQVTAAALSAVVLKAFVVVFRIIRAHKSKISL
jgi:hypothetical protein